MNHGRKNGTGQPCKPSAVRVFVGELAASAEADCVCGLAEYENRDLESVVDELLWEQKLNEEAKR